MNIRLHYVGYAGSINSLSYFVCILTMLHRQCESTFPHIFFNLMYIVQKNDKCFFGFVAVFLNIVWAITSQE